MIELLAVVFAAGLAFVKGRSTFGWAVATAFIGWFVLIPLLILRTKKDALAERAQKIGDYVERLETEKQFRDINTVDDLYKSLEKK